MHPLKLVSGSYFSETDLMQDNILLDEDLAWLLFGGNDLEGMTVHLQDVPFRISGVVARESDYASRKAYTAGMGLYMSYDSYASLSGEEAGIGISCYEVCVPNPVKGFGKRLADEKFPIGMGEIMENTGRFSFWNLLRIMKDLPARSIRSGPSLPYWENAARYAETSAALLLTGALAGLLGVGVTYLLLIPANRIIAHFAGDVQIRAYLPVTAAVILVALSIVLTLLGGLIPSRKAARQDPVAALRSE